MKTTTYCVVERAGGWVVNKCGDDPYRFPKCKVKAKDVAITEAKLLAEAAIPSAVRVFARDGSVETEWIFSQSERA